MAENEQIEKYITKFTGLTSMYKQIAFDQIAAAGGKDLHGANFSLGLSYLTEPFLMVAEAHKHDFDQIVFFLGGDLTNITEFQAEVEISFGEPLQKHLIDYASCVYFPAGLMHCPLNIVKVTKPIIFIDVTLSPGPSIRPLPSTSRRD